MKGWRSVVTIHCDMMTGRCSNDHDIPAKTVPQPGTLLVNPRVGVRGVKASMSSGHVRRRQLLV